jgi:hypothetical protein
VYILSKGLSVIPLRYTGLDVYIVVALNVKLPLLSAYKEEIFFVYLGRSTRKEEQLLNVLKPRHPT